MTTKASVRAKLLGLVSVMLLGIVAAPASRAALPPVTRIGCDHQAATSIRLGNNLRCADDGIVVTADDVTIDLNGHHITRSGFGGTSNIGITIGAGRSNVRIRNGVVRGFQTGVSMGGTDNTVSGLLLTHNGTAISVGGDRHRITQNRIAKGSGSDSNGILLAGTDEARVDRNQVGSVDHGISVRVGSDLNRVERNSLVGVALQGIFVQDGNTNTVSRNRLTMAQSINVQASSANPTGNVITRNVIAHGSSGIELNGSLPDHPVGTRVLHNRITDALGSGIHVREGAGTVLSRNVANRNSEAGITSEQSDVVITRNTTNFNGFEDAQGAPDSAGLGIAAPGATGGGNVAKGNDDDGGCDPAALCTVIAAPPPTGTFATCEMPVTESIKLANGVRCTGNTQSGLVIAADDITIDLNGHHLVSLANGPAGIDNEAGHRGVRVINGVISGWTFDVKHEVDTTPNPDATPDDAVIDRVLFTQDDGAAVWTLGGSGLRITRSTFIGGITALFAVNSPDALVRGNRIEGTTDDAIYLGGTSGGTVIDRNTITTGDYGVLVAEAFAIPTEPVTISRNTIRASELDGVKVDPLSMPSEPPTRLIGNSVRNAGQFGIAVYDGDDSGRFVVTGNRAERSSRYGFTTGLIGPIVFTRNVAIRNAWTGFGPFATDVIMDRNVANFNGFDDNNSAQPGLGIDANPAVTQKHNNSAKGNNATLQCFPEVLC